MAVNGIGNGYFYPVKNQETVGMKASDSKPSSRTVVNNGGVSYEKSISDAASSGVNFHPAVHPVLILYRKWKSEIVELSFLWEL